MSEFSVLIVDDELSIRSMIRYALEMAKFTVYEAEDAAQAFEVVSKTPPHLILLDWMLPNMSGIAFARRLKQERHMSEIPIIMITARADEENKITGLEVGADDYVVKPFSPRELVARIKAVLRRGPLRCPQAKIAARNLELDPNSQRVFVGDHAIRLGPLEYRLLRFMMSHPDRVYSRDELLSHVWSGDAYVDERTVDVHIRRLRKQLGEFNAADMIQTVHGTGYRFSETKDHE